MTRHIARLGGWLCGLLLLASSPASAQQALPEMTLEELMGLDAGRVFGASSRLQPVTEAPASVSFITAEEIARHGYRSLAEILRAVRGLYVTNDRNFSYLGARGFGRPGDYNSRILLMMNGHRVNDNVFGQAEVGPEFGLDPAMFERVEIVRGPASSLYGDSAFFAVVNVITKSADTLEGGSLSVEAGSLGTQLVRGTGGHRFSNGSDVVMSGTLERSAGMERLYFPAYDAPATNQGIAQGLDGERIGQFYAKARFGSLTLVGAYGRRERDVPTASFGSLFNQQEIKEKTTDRHGLLDAEYTRRVGQGALILRGSYDRFTYDGIYPLPDENGEALRANNGVLGDRWTAGVRFTHPVPGRQTLTVGAEYIDNLRQNQWLVYPDPIGQLFAADRSSTQQAIYVQDELKITRWMLLNAGGRYDRYQNFVKVTPRAALIVTPTTSQSIKYLYGRAFRAPNAYELNTFYFGARTHLLRPETIDTHEIVWESYTNDWLRTSVSAYRYNVDRLITLVVDDETFLGTTYVNQGRVEAKGLEFEAQMRLGGGLQGSTSFSLQRARDSETGEALVNSPRRMAKLRLSAPGPLRNSFISLDTRLFGSRTTLAGARLGAFVVGDINFVAPLTRTFDLTAGVRNVLDQQYADPVSDSHLQDSVVQNGRTVRVGLRWKLWGGAR